MRNTRYTRYIGSLAAILLWAVVLFFVYLWARPDIQEKECICVEVDGSINAK